MIRQREEEEEEEGEEEKQQQEEAAAEEGKGPCLTEEVTGIDISRYHHFLINCRSETDVHPNLYQIL